MNQKPLKNKTWFSGFTYKWTKKAEKYYLIIEEAKRVANWKVKDPITDSARLGNITLPLNNWKSYIVINNQSFNIIKHKHWEYNIEDIVVTANEFEKGVYISATSQNPEKLNLIKYIDDWYFILWANRFNWFSIVTFFEKFPNNKSAKKYLQSIEKRGIPIVGGTA